MVAPGWVCSFLYSESTSEDHKGDQSCQLNLPQQLPPALCVSMLPVFRHQHWMNGEEQPAAGTGRDLHAHVPAAARH